MCIRDRHNFVVRHVEELADTIRSAFRIAASGRPGPVLVDIPKDVTSAECEYIPGEKVEVHETYDVTEEQLKTVADLIAQAERPMIYFGGGVEKMCIRDRHHGDAPAQSLSESLDTVPLLLQWDARWGYQPYGSSTCLLYTSRCV